MRARAVVASARVRAVVSRLSLQTGSIACGSAHQRSGSGHGAVAGVCLRRAARARWPL